VCAAVRAEYRGMYRQAKRFRKRMTLSPGPTAAIWEGRLVPGVPSHIQQLARRSLRILNNVELLQEICMIDRLRVRRARCGLRSISLGGGWQLRFAWCEERCAQVALHDELAG
jgi:hypothetical protein